MRLIRATPVLLLALLGACASAPSQPEAPPAATPEQVSQSLPVPPPEPCEPVVEPAPEPVRPDLAPAFREAHNLYVSGNLEAAMLAYERLLARAEEPEDELNVLIALALIRMMPSSRVRDLEAAAMILEEIDKRTERASLFYRYFGQIELLRQIQSYEQRIANLHATNGSLKAELARKDEAIRKLRELTVGSSLSAP
jgi:hypothetical protein